MTSILVTGYKNTDLGIFSDKDIKIKLIKKAISQQILRYLDEGVDWFIFTGNLGFEYWFLEEARKFQKEYDFSMGTIFCFENQGQNWNDSNQIKLAQFKQLDFVKYAYEKYEKPSQLKNYQQFLLDNVDGIYIFYQEEMETGLKYLNQAIKDSGHSWIKRLDFDELNDLINDMAEEF